MTREVYVALQQFCEEDDEPVRLLEASGFQVRRNRLGRRHKKEELAAAIGGACAVLAGVETYDDAVLAAAPALKLISRCGVGVDSIDLRAAEARGVSVRTTADEIAEPVAQMALAMLLSLARNLGLHAADFREGKWIKRTGRLISELTVGLVGFGRIGRRFEELLRPLGPKILVHDPRPPATLPPGVLSVGFEELLSSSDVVSLHADRPKELGTLLGERELARMRPGAFLINTARGHLVDETALKRALDSGRLGGAALDVFAEEPYAGPLAEVPTLLGTPHVATLTRASRRAMELRAARHVVEFFS
jgi:D-3-phosphoglycerate dehydrogenase / 2-oxoglutarate reductase